LLVPTELVIKWNDTINLTEKGKPNMKYINTINALIDNIIKVDGISSVRTFISVELSHLSMEQLMSPSYAEVMIVRQYIAQGDTTIRMEIVLSYFPYSIDAINTLKMLKNAAKAVERKNVLSEKAYVVLIGGTAVY